MKEYMLEKNPTNSIKIEIPFPGQSRFQPYFIIALNKTVKCQH